MLFASFHRYHGLDPSRIQPMVDRLTNELRPPTGGELGCVNRFVLVDHPGGCVTGVTLWDDERRMLANDLAAAEDRREQQRGDVAWSTEPQIERHAIVADEHQLLAIGAAAIAA